MAGFYLEYNQHSLSAPTDPIGLVDLGECDIVGSFRIGPVRAAWNYWTGSKQWRVHSKPGRQLLIEGQPDRYPKSTESLTQWLDGRSGSFRGFEVLFDSEHPDCRPTVTVFVDPSATRPVFLIAKNGLVAVADKIADLAVNAPHCLEPDWAGLLENSVLGSLYSGDTTSIQGAVLLKPGTILGIYEGRIVWERKTSRCDGLIDPEWVRRDPVASLRSVFARAVNETWNDPVAALLLSGGLDSRMTLVAAEGRRRTVTLNYYPNETKLASQVAACCRCEHLEIDIADSYFENILTSSYLVTGGMHWSRFVAHLGLFGQLRRAGITGLCHGWPYNLIFRSWVARPYEKYPLRTSPLFDWMGSKAVYFQNYSCVDRAMINHISSVLTADGRDILREQLKKLAKSLEIVIIDQIDLTFERRLMSELFRQVFAGFILSALEGTDIYSPAFHPAVWSWYEASTPDRRYNEWVYREMLIQSKHAAFEIPDSSTNSKVMHLPNRWQDRWRNHFWYPPLRTIYLGLLRRDVPSENPWPKQVAVSALARALAVLYVNPLFKKDAIYAMFKRYEVGEIGLMDPLWALGAIGQWQEFVQTRTAPQARWIYEFRTQ